MLCFFKELLNVYSVSTNSELIQHNTEITVFSTLFSRCTLGSGSSSESVWIQSVLSLCSVYLLFPAPAAHASPQHAAATTLLHFVVLDFRYSSSRALGFEKYLQPFTVTMQQDFQLGYCWRIVLNTVWLTGRLPQGGQSEESGLGGGGLKDTGSNKQIVGFSVCYLKMIK